MLLRKIISFFLPKKYKRKFNKKLDSAIDLLDKDLYMCISLEEANINPHLLIGFNRESYHKFVKKYYPELSPYLYRYNSCWIEALLGIEKVLESKKKYLKQFYYV